MNTAKNKSLADRIIGASLVVGVAHILLKLTGFIQVKLAAYFLEPSIYEPVMVVAFTGVINSLFLIGEEVIGPSFLTIFMKEKEDKSEKAAWDYANVTLSFQALILLAVTASIICMPDFYIGLFTKWTEAENPERYQLLRTSLRILAPSLFFLSIGSTTYVLLNGYKKFFLAAFGDASTKVCVIVGLAAGMWLFGFGIEALFFGILIGSVAKVLTHLSGMIAKIRLLRPSLNWRNPAFQTMLVLMLPLLAGIIFAKVRDNFNNIYILTHIDQQGVLMANDLGRKLFSTIQWLVPYALQIALFPFLCELVSKKDRQKLGDILSSSCRLLLAVFVPGAVALAILAMPISILIFLGGKTGIELASWAGISTACYCLVLPAAAVECVLMQGSFADQKTVAVTVIGILSSICSVFVSYLFIVVIGVEAHNALVVVALGFVLSRCLKSIALALYLRRTTPMFPAGPTLVFLLKLTLLAAAVGLVTWGVSLAVSAMLPDGVSAAIADPAQTGAISRLRIAVRLAAAAAAAAATFLAAGFALRLEEPKQMIRWTIGKAIAKIGRPQK